LHKSHVNLIHIRTLFTIHFDRNKIPIQDLSDFFILKRFLLHHMAPMASGVANGKKYQLVLVASFDKGLISPRVPVHRVGGVLKEVR
jgi:hypothetical protein